MELDTLAERPLSDLSGGQRQRAWLAMILAQDAAIVLLDEPTTYLDISHQVELLDLMRELSAEGKTVITVLHDINQACRYADHLAVMQGGRLVMRRTGRRVDRRAGLPGLRCASADHARARGRHADVHRRTQDKSAPTPFAQNQKRDGGIVVLLVSYLHCWSMPSNKTARS